MYFEVQGNSEKEPLPTMSKIVDYCIKYPRLLRSMVLSNTLTIRLQLLTFLFYFIVRDSPLKVLHDPSLPYVLVHDWYIGISLDYLETSVIVLLEQWEKVYKKKRHDPGQITDHFVQLVNDIYECYEHTGLALNMPFPEGSSLAATELKDKVKYTSIALIKEKITSSFTTARTIFYDAGSNTIEHLFRSHLQTHAKPTFAYLFSHRISKYQGPDLEYQVQTILDSNLPGLVDVFNLSDEMLKESSTKSFRNDEQNDIEIDNWLIPDHTHTLTLEQYEQKRLVFSTVCEKLNVLLLTPDWIFILKEKIEARLNTLLWKDNWTVSMVSVQLKWLHVLILPWLSYVIPKSGDVDSDWNNFLRQKIKAEHVLYELIYQSRIPKIFDIIRDYPTTKEAILDFHVIATKRDLLQDLQQKLMEELQDRLLHLGASASDILQQYIACIQCLAIIDPSCGIMGPVIEMIESYMKRYRNDAVQGVVELIRDQEEDEFFPAVQEEDVYVFKQSELTNQETPRDTVIIKEDKPAMLRRLQQKSRDSVAMLISMCNSLEDFIKGYSNKLGEVLLLTKNYDTDAEVRKLELLKRHFPAHTFLRCDIMLRDLDISRRLDKSIHENKDVSESLHAIIMSGFYWPGGDDDSDVDDLGEDDEEEIGLSSLQSWPEFERSVRAYETEFKKAKASRKLKFVPSMGSVTLELEFKTRKLKLDVCPEAALIIALFKTKEDSFTRDQIKLQVKISKEKVVEQLDFWIKQQVLELSAEGYFQLIED
ncbi:hypothetical protein BDF21DRAFT_414476 [Thamnidium elegans]|nr:hypothetical protein BDF21DRAFT_414476 [Thamnidium elegans]